MTFTHPTVAIRAAVWIEDAAGITPACQRSRPAAVRLPTPDGRFDPANAGDPRLIGATVVDHESAVAGATIELRREGGATGMSSTRNCREST